MCADIYLLQLLQNSQGRQNVRSPRVRLVHSRYPQRVTGAWWPMAVHRPRNILRLLVKRTSSQPYKFFIHVCRLLFQLFTPPIHIYKRRQHAPGGSASLLSVVRFPVPPCSGMGGHAHSCFNAAVYMWILRKAWFVRHGVRRENRVIS